MAVATLLAVEDNPTHQYVLSRFCQLFDYQVHIVATAEEALAAVAAANYAGILLDLTLPGMDGLEFARRLRAREKMSRSSHAIPIIALTARDTAADRQACYDAGMNDYLSKPFDPEELRKVLLRWVYEPNRPNLKILRGSVEQQLFQSDLWMENR